MSLSVFRKATYPTTKTAAKSNRPRDLVLRAKRNDEQTRASAESEDRLDAFRFKSSTPTCRQWGPSLWRRQIGGDLCGLSVAIPKHSTEPFAATYGVTALAGTATTCVRRTATSPP